MSGRPLGHRSAMGGQHLPASIRSKPATKSGTTKRQRQALAQREADEMARMEAWHAEQRAQVRRRLAGGGA